MTIFDRIKTFFKIGGAKMGAVSNLTAITDHPKIGVSGNEYNRINTNLKFLKGDFEKVSYKNTYGNRKARDYVSLNMAQVASRRMASLIFNEQFEFSIDGNDAANDYAHSIFDNNDFKKNFERYLESALALGGLAMKPYVSGGQVKIAYVQAPMFYPLNSNTNDISEAAIATHVVRTEKDKQIYYTLLEFHEWADNTYVVSNELYRSENPGQVGVNVPLANVYEDLAEWVKYDNISRPLFVYLKPFGFNNKDIVSPLGISIYDNAHNTLQSINDTFDQFHWEIKMGQRRVAIPESMTQLQFEGDSQTPREYFDADQNVFVQIPGDIDNTNINDLTTGIRANEYISAMTHFLKTLEVQLGLSSGMFSFDGQGLKTATEVVSEDSMTYQTRNSHLSNVERAIQELIISCLELAKFTGLYAGEIPTLADITIDTDDGVFTDKGAEADYHAKLIAMGIESKQAAMMKVLDISEDEAEKMFEQITYETQPPNGALDNSMFGG